MQFYQLDTRISIVAHLCDYAPPTNCVGVALPGTATKYQATTQWLYRRPANYSDDSRSPGRMFRAEANRQMFTSEMLRLPRSTPPR